jgi:hypothetical protein
VVWFIGVADGGRGFAANEAAGDGAVELVPGGGRGPAGVGWELLIAVINTPSTL